MKLLALFLFPLAFFAQTVAPVSIPASGNVNSRYTVEAIELDNRIQKHLSRSLREQVNELVGKNFDAKRVSDLAGTISKEVRRKVTSALEKGSQPDHVRIVFRSNDKVTLAANGTLNKLHYHSQLGLTADVNTDFGVGRNRVAVGFQTDAEEHLEREIGWSAEVARPFGERVRAKLSFAALRQKWNAATLTALRSRSDIPGIYRERYVVDPELTIAIVDGLTFSTGVDIQHFETQFPAAQFEASNAWTNTLRLHKRWEADESSSRQGLDAGYSLKVATKALDSDFAYTRHLAYLTYRYRFGQEELLFRGLAGELNGRAPLFERFVLGDSRTLRGWNRFDLDPVGGARMAHASAQYRYSHFAVFYDTGAVWDPNGGKQMRHSVGATAVFEKKTDGPYLTLAFPLRAGSVSPVFMLGMHF